MTKLVAVARFALAEFGPLIVFWLLALTLGVKPAILGSIVFIVVDAVWRWRKGLKFTRLYLLVSALTLIFGFVDLISTSPFMLKYEAAVSNVVTGIALVIGALGENRSSRRSPSSAARASSPPMNFGRSSACSRSSGRRTSFSRRSCSYGWRGPCLC